MDGRVVDGNHQVEGRDLSDEGLDIFQRVDVVPVRDVDAELFIDPF